LDLIRNRFSLRALRLCVNKQPDPGFMASGFGFSFWIGVRAGRVRMSPDELAVSDSPSILRGLLLAW